MPPPRVATLPVAQPRATCRRTAAAAILATALSLCSLRAAAQNAGGTTSVAPAPAAPLAAPSVAPSLVEPLALPLVTPSPPVTQNPSGTPNPAVAPSANATPATGRRLAAFRVSADRISFYSNRFIVSADGNVDVTLGDGTHVAGNTFAMDLRLNRFVVAGDVKVTAAGKRIDGAAFAEYFDFDRAYFVPIVSEPDRWTFAAGDYAHPLLGRQMPGDTFFLPDLSGERVFLVAKRATIDPKQSVRFTPADINFGLTSVPFPAYFLSFSPNPNFAQNALNGADADGPLDFAGGSNDLATLHLRYDPANKLYPAYEQHRVSNNSYVVASVNPLTRPLKQYNVLAFDRISPGLQVQVQLQETAFQHAFSRPLSATAYAALQVTASLPHSYLALTTQSYYDSLLARPQPGIGGGLYYGDPSHNWIGDHPTQAQLAWIGFRHPVYSLPLTFQVRSSFGVATNTTTPLQSLGGFQYTTLYDKAVGLNVTTKPVTLLKDKKGLRRDLYLTAYADKQRTFYSSPHHVDIQTESASLTKVVDPLKLTLFASYLIQNTGDFYGAQQPLAYQSVSAIDPLTGLPIPGYRAFRGFGTIHSLTQQLVYSPTPLLTLNAALRENRDFPRPVAGPPLVVGSTTVFNNYGFTPYEADFDLRYRINRLLVLDIARSYYFNFGGYERWSPQFSFQISK